MSRILLVEDDTMIASGILYAFETEGYETNHVTGIKDARSLILSFLRIIFWIMLAVLALAAEVVLKGNIMNKEEISTISTSSPTIAKHCRY